MSITKKEVYTLAKNVKEYVEKNKRIPTSITINNKTYNWGQMAYILAFATIHPGKDFNVASIKNAPKSQGDTIDEKVELSDYKNQAQRTINYINKHTRCPNFVRTVKSQKKARPKMFIYAFARAVVFYQTNKRLPNYLVYDSKVFTNNTSTTKNTTTKKTTATKKTTTKKNNCKNPFTSAPHYTTQGAGKLGQQTGYYCACNCIHQVMKKFGITKYSQKQIAAWAGTTSAGTGHPGIETAIAKIGKLTGKKFTVKWYYMSDLGKTTSEQFAALAKMICKPNVAGFEHMGYQDSGSKASGTIFGHYEMIDIIDTSKKQVRALNSLGNKCGAPAYCGHLQWRSYDLEKHYLNNKKGVKSICIVTMG